jgi:hypothetical protein
MELLPVFAERFGIRPWELEWLTQAELDVFLRRLKSLTKKG